MAGIGFELRKIFGKKTLFTSTMGVLYSTFTIVGASVVFIFLLFGLRLLMQLQHCSQWEHLYFTGTFTNVFLFASILTGILNTAVSRYVSDMIFENKEREIAAAVLGVMIVSLTITGLVFGGFSILLYTQQGRSLLEVSLIYLFALLAVNTYNMVTFVSALKQYKEVTLTYFVGAVVALVCFTILLWCKAMDNMEAIFFSLVIGFFTIGIRLWHCCLKSFGLPKGNLFAFLGSFLKYPKLVLSGLFYVLTLYGSNVIYWYCSDLQVQTGVFNVAPTYDLAMFLAILINLSGMVVFEIKTETSFYEEYVAYLSALEKGSYAQIQTEQRKLQKKISLQIFYVYEVQLIITILLICALFILYPYFGIPNEVMQIVSILGMGIYCVMNMYYTVIFLYYFEDHKGACVGPAFSCFFVLVGCLICCQLGEPYYPLPILFGGLVGWIASFLVLRYRVKHLTKYLFCK